MPPFATLDRLLEDVVADSFVAQIRSSNAVCKGLMLAGGWNSRKVLVLGNFCRCQDVKLLVIVPTTSQGENRVLGCHPVL